MANVKPTEVERDAHIAATALPESGYGTLFRNVAAGIEESDPCAAQALLRAATDVEQLIVESRQLKRERDDFEQRLHAYKSGEIA